MDDYNLKRIADAVEEIARELKFRRELQYQDTGKLNSRVDGLEKDMSLIKQYIKNLK